jgi:hypothetical protein
LLFDIRNANRASLPPIVNIVDLAKFRPHDLPTLQPLTTLPETCLELDHELTYTNLVIKSLPALWSNHSLLFDCPLVKTSMLFLSSVLMVQTLDRNFANVRKKETLSNGQIQNFYKAILTILINSTKEENIIESR